MEGRLPSVILWRAAEAMSRTLATAPSPAPAPATDPGIDLIGPIAGTGLVGIFLLCVILRFKIQPTYVFDDAKKEWDRERGELQDDIAELKAANKELQGVYTAQVIPTLTRVLDAERELVDLRRDEQAERRRRDQRDGDT